MSTHNDFYVEARVNGEWRWIDPLYPNKEGENRRINFWGRSNMNNTYEKIEDQEHSDSWVTGFKRLKELIKIRVWDLADSNGSLEIETPRIIATQQ